MNAELRPLKPVAAWVELHRDEWLADWELAGLATA